MTLTPRQSTVAMLLALGHTQTEASEKTGVRAPSISKWLKTPDMQAAIEDYRKQMFDRLAGKTAEEVMADAPNTFKRLKELREERENLQVSLGACRELFSRQVPAQTKHQEDHTIRIVLERKEEQHARAVLEEDRVMNISEAEVLDAPSPSA